MGEVWSAEHLTLNTKVAVKFLSTGATGAAARVAIERFRFEAQVSAQLGQRTSHVVAVHDAESDASGPFLVMEHVSGRTLRAELTRKRQLDTATVAAIVDQMSEALSVAHGLGVVHRDLKPSNLLLVERSDGSFHVKVADFGIAKALRADLDVDRPDDTSDGGMIGSPPYMSPEQMLGAGTVDAHTDMWATAVIVYETLTGRLPFPGRTVAEIIVNMANGRFEMPSQLRPSLPPELDDWFRRALARHGCDRFASMAELALELRIAVSARSRRLVPRAVRGAVIALSLTAALVSLSPSPGDELPAPIPAAEPVPRGAERGAGSKPVQTPETWGRVPALSPTGARGALRPSSAPEVARVPFHR
jgi:eukaryotic-like serine/threonine-protein kinase